VEGVGGWAEFGGVVCYSKVYVWTESIDCWLVV
jgi:hypothetical protein